MFISRQYRVLTAKPSIIFYLFNPRLLRLGLNDDVIQFSFFNGGAVECDKAQLEERMQVGRQIDGLGLPRIVRTGAFNPGPDSLPVGTVKEIKPEELAGVKTLIGKAPEV